MAHFPRIFKIVKSSEAPGEAFSQFESDVIMDIFPEFHLLTERAFNGSPRSGKGPGSNSRKEGTRNSHQEPQPALPPGSASERSSCFFPSISPKEQAFWPLPSTAQHTSLPPQTEGQHGCRQNEGTEERGHAICLQAQAAACTPTVQLVHRE